LTDFERNKKAMPKQANKEKALAALLTSPSIREASKASGLSEETITALKT
jgi:hypothetical protein